MVISIHFWDENGFHILSTNWIFLNFFRRRRKSMRYLQHHLVSQEQEKQLKQLLDRFQDVFSDVAGKLTGPPVKLHLKPGTTPVFTRAREIPYALRDAYAKEIESKITAGFYKKVEYSEWASTTHVVTRKNGRLRIIGNYKPTLNPRIIIDEHPIPRAKQIFNEMKGAKVCHHRCLFTPNCR